MIELKGVSKRFGAVQAVNNVDITFEPGKIYGLLGRNGAGKSTLLNMITGRVFPDSGALTLEGKPIIENDAALGKIYLMGESCYYPESMRIREVFKWAAEFYPGFDKVCAHGIAEQSGLDLRQKIKGLSTGMSTMFRLSVALATGAPYIFLDEPVLGLDAVHRDLFYKMLVQRYQEQPACYVISTHLIEEATGLIEDVVIIRDGQILLSEPTESLLARGYTVSGPASAVDEFTRGKAVIGHDTLGGMKSAYVMEKLTDPPQGLEIGKMNLQQLFVQLTK